MYIAHTMNHTGMKGLSLWDEHDGFYYSALHLGNKNPTHIPLRVRSMVGLIPLFAVATPKPELLDQLPDFKRHMQRFIENWSYADEYMEHLKESGQQKLLLALVNHQKLARVLKYMLDESEFLSPYGLRSLSRYYQDHPYTFEMAGISHRIDYEPAESTTDMFGGNSNWRGPIWFPVNYLMIESLQRFHSFYGETFKVEFPTGSGNLLSLGEVAAELSRRLVHIFLENKHGRRAVFGGVEKFQQDPHWCDFFWFYEYFNGDNGAGLGASHQTGWTGLVAYLLQESGERRGQQLTR
jgi:hypothetical protein